jgi:hypothetical protein
MRKTRKTPLICISVILLFCVNIIVVSYQMDLNNSTQLGAQNGNLPQTSSPIYNNSSLWNLQGGLVAGKPTSEPQYISIDGNMRILIGIQMGLIILDINGNIVQFVLTQYPVIDFQVVDDLNEDGFQDVFLILKNQNSDNILAYSLHEDRILWKKVFTYNGFYEYEFSYIEYKLQPWELLSYVDINNDGVDDLFISAWNFLYCLDGTNGNIIWENNNFEGDMINFIEISDINQDTINEFILSCEKGQICAINPQNGNIIWQYETKGLDFEIGNWMNEDKTVMHVQFPIDSMTLIDDINSDDKPDILAASEDSYIYCLTQYGNEINVPYQYIGLSEQIPLYEDAISRIWNEGINKINQIQLGHKGVHIEETIDFDSDGTKEVLVFSNLWRNDLNPYEDSLNISILDLNDELPYTKLSEHSITGIYSEIPILIKNATGKTWYYDISFLSYSFDIGYYSAPYSQNLGNFPSGTKIQPFSGSTIDEATTNYEFGSFRILLPDIDSDGINDVFFANFYGICFLVSGVNGSIIWDRNVDEISQSNANIDYKSLSDLNNDGIIDFLKTMTSDTDPTLIDLIRPKKFEYIGVISGIDGDIIWDSNQITENYEIYNFEQVGDFNGDGIQDYIILLIPDSLSSSDSSYLASLDNNVEDYAKILSAYCWKDIKLDILNGRTGEILNETIIQSSPYKFSRNTEYSGSYTNPSGQSVISGYYYNRINGEEPSSNFISNNPSNPHNFDLTKDIDNFITPSSMNLVNTPNYSGNILNLSEYEVNGGGHLEVESVPQDGTNIVLGEFNFTIDFSDDDLLGVQNYPLSQIERFSAFNLQNQLKVNSTANPYSLSYALYNFTSESWVELNWSSSGYLGLEHIWDLRFPDYFGNYSTESRSSYNTYSPELTYTTDKMWLSLRGTRDFDPAVEIDVENPTALSHCIDPSTKNIKIRINMTNDFEPFNVTLDTLGLQTYYWSIINPRFDNFGVYNYVTDTFTEINLRTLSILDFDLINGTGDEYLDVVMIEGYYTSSIGTYAHSKLILSDLFAGNQFIKETSNLSSIPFGYVNIIADRLNSQNSFTIFGKFLDESSEYALKHIDSFVWDEIYQEYEQINFAPVIQDVVFNWVCTPPIHYDMLYYHPFRLTIDTNNNSGVAFFTQYEYSSDEYNIFIVNCSNGEFSGAIKNIEEINLFDFDLYEINGDLGTLSIEEIDFNKDGIYDFVYSKKPDYYYSSTRIGGIVILSGISSIDTQNYLLSIEMDEYYELSISDKSFLEIFTEMDGFDNSFLLFGQQIKNYYVSKYYKYYSSSSIDVHNFGAEYDYYWSIEFYDNLHKIQDINNDGHSEIIWTKYQDHKEINTWGYQYASYEYTEIYDISNNQVLYRFNSEIENAIQIGDTNGDGKSELVIVVDNNLYCIDSKFSLEIDESSVSESLDAVSLTWNTDFLVDKFEIYIDGNYYSTTHDNSALLVYGEGIHTVSIFMLDTSGLIFAVDNIQITFTNHSLMLITTIVSILALIGLGIFFKIRVRNSKNISVLDTNPDKKGNRNETGINNNRISHEFIGNMKPDEGSHSNNSNSDNTSSEHLDKNPGGNVNE